MYEHYKFNAEEARKLTEKSIDLDLTSIFETIREHAQKGEFNCYYYERISQYKIKKLNELGFEVNDYSSQEDGICYKISWEKSDPTFQGLKDKKGNPPTAEQYYNK